MISLVEIPDVYGMYSILIEFLSSHLWLIPSCFSRDSPDQSSPWAIYLMSRSEMSSMVSQLPSSPMLTQMSSTHLQALSASILSPRDMMGSRLYLDAKSSVLRDTITLPCFLQFSRNFAWP